MSLRALLTEYADKAMPKYDSDEYYERYSDNTNQAALTDAWLEDSSSYIWRVGVLTRIDNNKSDWMFAFIGHERAPGQFEFIGSLHYADGENDDPGRCLARALELLSYHHPSFDPDRHVGDEDEVDKPMTGFKAIEQDPDWATLTDDHEKIVRIGYETVDNLLCSSGHNPGFLMRGASLAIADYYETKDLARGMLSSIRALRNAFAAVFRKRS